MAHRILGLDIGKRAVRLAIADKSLRQTALTGWDEEPVAPAQPDQSGSHARHALFSPEQVAAVAQILQRNQRPDDVITVAMPAMQVMHRTLLFPFVDDKAIAEAVGFELENHIPTPISELVIDFLRLGSKDGQSEVLALAAPRDAVIKQIEAYKDMGIEARRVGLQSLAYAHLIRKLPDVKDGVTMLVDVGSQSSEVVVTVDGHTQMLRSFAVGGETIADLFASLVQSDLTPAELLSHHAQLLPDEVLQGDQERALALATRQALQPMLRELRQTLSHWLKRAHRRPDRILLTGGLSRLAGLHEYIERMLELPVSPIRLGDMPDMRLGNAQELGDRGALAVALALSAADTETSGDVDFRQGDLAYEGDFKILRQRLPQMVTFVVIALCLMGIRASLNYRALVIEQEQQLSVLQAMSKQLTGKASTDFEAVKKELEREPAVDMAALYPDISAFKVLEDVSNILDKVTEPPDFKAPGGPEEEGTPQPRMGIVAPPGLRLAAPTGEGLPGMGGAARSPEAEARARRARGAGRGSPEGDDTATETGTAPQPAQPPTAGPLPVPPGAPPLVPGMMPPPSAPGSAPAADGDSAKGGANPDQPFTGHKIEFASVQIERGRATLRGDADTQDALLALQQAIDAHRCFSKVKSSSDRITFERHKDWFKFTVEFEVSCPTETEKAKKGKGTDADKADKADDAEGE